MTTWKQRFIQALTLFCNKEPPAKLVDAWVNHEEHLAFNLQQWAVDNSQLSWAQGIAVLDAAHLLADQPCEGEGHEAKP